MKYTKAFGTSCTYFGTAIRLTDKVTKSTEINKALKQVEGVSQIVGYDVISAFDAVLDDKLDRTGMIPLIE